LLCLIFIAFIVDYPVFGKERRKREKREFNCRRKTIMKRRSFLVGALSTTTVLLTGKRSNAGILDTWRSYNTDRFSQVRYSLVQNNARWIDVDLRRMRVTGLQGDRIISYQQRPLFFVCDDGDVHNPTITGLFTPDGMAEIVPMSGRRQLPSGAGYKEYTNVITSK